MATKRTPRTKRTPNPTKPARVDGWENATSGLGVLGSDKRLGAVPYAEVYDQATAEELWLGDHLAAKIVESPAIEVFREGYTVVVPDDHELQEKIEDEKRRLNVDEKLQLAECYRRAFGGGGVLISVDDGQALSSPLDVTKVKAVSHLTVFSPRELTPEKWYSDPLKPNYGEIESYRLTPIVQGSVGPSRIVHSSRLVILQGILAGPNSKFSSQIPGWGFSIFTRVAGAVRDFQAALDGTGILTQDIATPTLKIVGLAKLLATNEGAKLTERAKGIEAARSIARVTILDKEEEYERKTASVAGLSDLVDQLKYAVASAAEMPVSLLMGQAPAGLNATGDSDIRWYYDRTSGKQKRLEPSMRRIFDCVLAVLAKKPSTSKADALNPFGAPEDEKPEGDDLEAETLAPSKVEKQGPVPVYSFEWAPLWQPTELEREQARKTVAERDVLYIDAGVVTAVEIAKSRFGQNGWSSETTVDTDLRDELEADDELQKHELGGNAVEAAKQEAENAKRAAENGTKPGAPSFGSPPKEEK